MGRRQEFIGSSSVRNDCKNQLNVFVYGSVCNWNNRIISSTSTNRFLDERWVRQLTSKVVAPEKYELRGIFTIAPEGLILLDGILKQIAKDYKNYGRRQLSDIVNRKLNTLQLDPAVHKERIQKETKSQYPFSDNGINVVVVCRSNKKFSGATFASIMDNPAIVSERPIKAEIKIKYGDAQLKIQILGEYVVNCIDISVSPNNSFAERAAFRIRQWANDQKRFDHLSRLANPSGAMGFALLCFAFLVLPVGLFKTVSDKSATLNQANQLLDHGVMDTELTKAIELILRFQMNSFETTTSISIKPWFVTLLVMGTGLFAFSIFCPKSMIALGLNVRRLYRDQFFYGRAWIWIGAWATAIFTSAVGSNLYEYVRDNLMTTK